MDEAGQRAALAQLELTDLWGLAGRMAVRLAALGITSPLQLRAADPNFLRQHISVVMERMVLELRGIPCLALEEALPPRKTLMVSRSFGRPVQTREELGRALATYMSRAAEKLRGHGLVTPCVQVFAQTNRHREDQPQYHGALTVHLPVATGDTGRLLKAARHGVESIFRPGLSYAKAGVLCLDLHAAAAVQSTLFHQPDSPAQVALMAAADALNARYGRGCLRFAAAELTQGWARRSEFNSPRYTTRFKELLQAD